jgi:hypothetical protein
VDDAERVRLVDRLAGLKDEIHRLVARERSASREVRGERLAFEVVHDDEGNVAVAFDLVHLGDAAARDAPAGAGFLEEATRDVGARRELGVEKLQRDEPTERQVLRREDGVAPRT